MSFATLRDITNSSILVSYNVELENCVSFQCNTTYRSLTLQAVKSAVKAELATFAADRVGKVDYALASAGGSVIASSSTYFDSGLKGMLSPLTTAMGVADSPALRALTVRSL